MIYIILFVISLFPLHTWASRSVPQEYIAGIENKLPANYNKLFQIADKDSPQYTVVAHELAMDLMFIAEQERKAGRLSMSFDFLKLANFIFPHRGDISKKFQNIAEQVSLYLNASSTPCNEYYEIMLREIKTNFPAMMATIDQQKCEQINKIVRDTNEEILALEKKARDEGALRSAAIQKQLLKFMDKEELTQAQEAELISILEKAYLGHIEFKAHNIELNNSRDMSIRMNLSLVRKYSSLSYEGMKQTYINLTGKDFSSYNLFKKPIRFQFRFIQNDKITTYPVDLKIKDPSYFNIWLNSLNFLSYGGYNNELIFHKNDVYCMELDGGKIKIELLNPFANKRLNLFVVHGIPYEIVESSKMVDLIPLN
ncbi:MAG: hypothetical protein ACOVP4_06290 [Bacteriovoracaceae bacterium]